MTEQNAVPSKAAEVTAAIKFSDRRQLGNGYVAYPEYGAFYKAQDRETLLFIPMNADGTPDTDDKGKLNAGEVEFSLIDEESAAECRAILKELLTNDVVGANYWQGVEMPEFLRNLIGTGKIRKNYYQKSPGMGFNLTMRDGRIIVLYVQNPQEDRRDYQSFKRFVFITPEADILGEDRLFETESEEEAAVKATELIFGISEPPQ